jgi:succinyl-diaminopimelate desuccinylase
MEGLEPHEELGPVTFTTSVVEGGDEINSIPQNVRIVTDSRIPPNHDAEELASRVERMVKPELKENDSIKTEPLEEPVDISNSDQYVNLFVESAEKAGVDPELDPMEAYTELGLYHEALDIPGVVFGTSPGLEIAHSTYEYVEIESIPAVQETFENMIEKMNK